MQKGLTYDDVLLVPQYSTLNQDQRFFFDFTEELSWDYQSLLLLWIHDEADMAGSLGELGGLSIIHRYNSIEEQSAMIACLMRTL